jgi:hypothetical protein
MGICAALIGIAVFAEAGAIADTDGDLIPDVFDNCREVASGPNDTGCQQTDSDGDGFGNVCDADYSNDGVVAGTDFAIWAAGFGGTDPVLDQTCDGVVAGSDFGFYSGLFCSAPGPGATAL